MKELAEKESSPWRWIAISIVVVASVLIAWLMSWDFITRQFGNPTRPGEFGDMFGAVNALFSGLAFAGVIVAILMQQAELSLQRQELRLQREEQVDTRRELARSAEAQEEQVMALKRQSETLRVTAELNARTSLMQAYGGGPGPGVNRNAWELQLAQLKRVLEELDPEYTP